MQPKFSDHAWADYLYWFDTDRKQVKRINALIEDIRRHPFEGLGKPEPLKHQLSGFWSRRIDSTHRLVYAIEGQDILIAQCRDHY
jgi:toxin YoeB